jgi:hypothetical protein
MQLTSNSHARPLQLIVGGRISSLSRLRHSMVHETTTTNELCAVLVQRYGNRLISCTFKLFAGAGMRFADEVAGDL